MRFSSIRSRTGRVSNEQFPVRSWQVHRSSAKKKTGKLDVSRTDQSACAITNTFLFKHLIQGEMGTCSRRRRHFCPLVSLDATPLRLKLTSSLHISALLCELLISVPSWCIECLLSSHYQFVLHKPHAYPSTLS